MENKEMEKEFMNFAEQASHGMLSNDKYIYGLSGLCAFLCVSHPTGQKIKNERLEGCYMQYDRVIIFDTEMVRKRLGIKYDK